MKIIQSGLTDTRYHKADVVLWGSNPALARPGDVTAINSSNNVDAPTRSLSFPQHLEGAIKVAIDRGYRVSVGNGGVEVTFRHIFGNYRKLTCWNDCIQQLLKWGDAAHAIAGDKLVLAPMDVEISYDVATGCRFLKWAAERKVPLVICCGFRFLFPADAFKSIIDISRRVPWSWTGSPHEFPFAEVSEAIKHSGAELWTGAGFADGLNAGSLARAEEFGFAGVFTNLASWQAWEERPRHQE